MADHIGFSPPGGLSSVLGSLTASPPENDGTACVVRHAAEHTSEQHGSGQRGETRASESIVRGETQAIGLGGQEDVQTERHEESEGHTSGTSSIARQAVVQAAAVGCCACHSDSPSVPSKHTAANHSCTYIYIYIYEGLRLLPPAF